MSFYKKWFSSPTKQKSYDKYGDLLKKTNTSKEQRLEAIESLEKAPPEQAIPQLLKRFEMVLESGLQDQREKEQCMKIIVSFGDKAKKHIESAMKTTRRVAWPIKISEKIFSHEEYLNLLLNSLTLNMDFFDEDVIEHNEEILLALKDIHSLKIIEKAAAFLTNRNESLRIAALECLEAQALQFEEAKQIILNLAHSPSDDNSSRFLGLVSEIVKKHGWQ